MTLGLPPLNYPDKFVTICQFLVAIPPVCQSVSNFILIWFMSETTLVATGEHRLYQNPTACPSQSVSNIL